jgi:hypothetical protein
MVILEDISDDEAKIVHLEVLHHFVEYIPHPNLWDVESCISMHALTSLFAPQTLKMIGYIKNHKVIVLIDNGSTHNFIHRRVAQENHCYIHLMNNFQIMIANGGSMKCGGCCQNVRLQMGDYFPKTHMFAMEMGGYDIFLGVEWLWTLSPISMDFHGLYTSFQ